MRKVVFVAAAIVASVSLFVVSCNKQGIDPTSTQGDNDYLLCNPYDFIGQMHNEGLKVVMDGLAATKGVSPAAIPEEEIVRLTEDYCEKVFASDSRFFIGLKTKAGEDDLLDMGIDTTFSEAAQMCLDRMMDALNSDDYSTIKESISNLEMSLLSDSCTFSDYEKTLLLCSLAVGKYSNEYWNEEFLGTKSRVAYAIGTVVGADLVGAGKGIAQHAVEILICGVIGGPGCGLAAAGRAALVPAIVGSVGAGVMVGCGFLAEAMV